MINTALEQIQKLFGRGFLIAAVVPSLLFVAAASYLWWGFDVLRETVLRWSQQGIQEVLFDVLLVVASVYVLAYMVYGVRSALHQLYQGHWNFIPLKWLRPVRLDAAIQAKQKRQAEVRSKLELLIDPGWAIDFDFGPTHSSVQLETPEAKEKLMECRQALRQLVTSLQTTKILDETAYAHLLHDARILQANQDAYPPTLKADVEDLVAKLRQAYQKWPKMQTAVARFFSLVYGEYALASSDLNSNFPPDENLRPTRLGNVVSASESSIYRRYGIPLSDLWPRLLSTLPEDTHKRVEEAAIYLDFAVIMSFYAFSLALFAGIAAVYGPPRVLWWRILLPILFLLSGLAFYQLAIQSARIVGLQMNAAVDLFRLKLLDALDVERPSNIVEEKKTWGKIYDHMIHGYQTQDQEPLRFKGGEKQENEEPALWNWLKSMFESRQE